ncbi:MAG TPA: ATP-binding protein [Blastocatellia bacterium]|nr:ATP-binding protein [Blastocatellia bacterium]
MMAETNGFPRHLLTQSATARRNYFRACTIAHPHLAEVYRRLRTEIATVEPGTLLFIYGPSGIGKTTLLQRLAQKVAEEMSAALVEDVSRIPLVTVEALSPETGNFNWKDFYRRLLLKLDEPCLDRKIIPWLQTAEYDEQKQLLLGSRTAGTVYRYTAEQVLRHRRPVALCIDEAQHLANVTSGRRLQSQLDCVKSLSNLTGIPIVLCGHYELLAFRNLSAQLSRRSVDLHFRRYRADDEAERQAFKNVVWSFACHLPLAETPALVAQWDYLYERSLGCVGVLKLWLAKALAAALAEGGERLTPRHLADTALSLSRCEKLLAELREGETLLYEAPEAAQQLRGRLGLSEASEAASARPNDKNLHPGKRRPRRDPIGTNA